LANAPRCPEVAKVRAINGAEFVSSELRVIDHESQGQIPVNGLLRMLVVGLLLSGCASGNADASRRADSAASEKLASTESSVAMLAERPDSAKRCPSGRARRVPALPPDTLPEWIHADSNVVDGGRVIAGPIAKHIVVMAFDSAASSSQRAAAVASICGILIGGIRMEGLGGLYFVNVPQAVTPAQIVAAADRAYAMPGVALATPDMLGEGGLDSSAPSRPRRSSSARPQ
jgi:hypothetical protein